MPHTTIRGAHTGCHVIVCHKSVYLGASFQCFPPGQPQVQQLFKVFFISYTVLARERGDKRDGIAIPNRVTSFLALFAIPIMRVHWHFTWKWCLSRVKLRWSPPGAPGGPRPKGTRLALACMSRGRTAQIGPGEHGPAISPTPYRFMFWIF